MPRRRRRASDSDDDLRNSRAVRINPDGQDEWRGFDRADLVLDADSLPRQNGPEDGPDNFDHLGPLDDYQDEELAGPVGEVVAVLPGGHETHFALNTTYELGITERNRQRYKFIGVFGASFSNETVPIGWCSDPDCPDAEQHAAEIFTGSSGDRFQSTSSAAFLQGRPASCAAATGLLSTWNGGWFGGELGQHRAAAAAAAPAPAQEATARTHDFQHTDGSPAKAVQADPARFSSWGVLLQHVSVAGWFCTSCPDAHTCEHMRAAVPGSAMQSTLSHAEFERKLTKSFDLSSGARKLRCLSRAQLPQHLHTDAALSNMYKGKHRAARLWCASAWSQQQAAAERCSGRLAIPAHCHLAAELLQQPCSECGQVQWDQAAWQHSQVVQPAALASTNFEIRACLTAGCTGQLQVDGKDHGLLRKTSELAFSLELLYQWADRMRTGSPDTWTQAWRVIISQMHGLSLQQQKQLWRMKQHFSEATLDFIQLQQISYDAGFRCNCWQDGVTMDGMTLSFKKSKARIVHNWLEQHEDRGVQGAAFSARIFLTDKTIRTLMAAFAGPSPGLSQLQYDDLKDRLARGGPQALALLPFVQTGVQLEQHWRAQPGLRAVLSSLSTTAAVSQLLRPSVAVHVQTLLQDQVLTLEAEQALQQTSPVMHAFLKAQPGGPLHEHTRTLLMQIVQVAAAAQQALEERLADRPARQTPGAPEAPPAERPPQMWSREEAMLRTCSWGALAPEPWQRSAWGGTDVLRQPRCYAADSTAARTAEDCTKHQKSTISLLPGVMLYWCMTCWKCIFFHVMGSAESPKTVFDVLYARFPQPPKRICMDNACNLHAYVLNREPEHFRDVHWYIDEAHFRGHKHCSPAYNTGLYNEILNSALAEQKNSRLRRLENHVSYMSQFTFMIYLRYYLYELNMLQERRTAGEDFTQPQ